jgi:hypothetical protein
LDLLWGTDARFLELARNLRYIVLVGGGGETYLHPLRAYLVDARLLATRSSLQFASAIVHEATHAEMARSGITYESNDPKRVEEICLEAELEFLESAGCSSEVLEAKRKQMAVEWWSDRELKKRRLEQLSAHGVPRFLRRLWGKE